MDLGPSLGGQLTRQAQQGNDSDDNDDDIISIIHGIDAVTPEGNKGDSLLTRAVQYCQQPYDSLPFVERRKSDKPGKADKSERRGREKKSSKKGLLYINVVHYVRHPVTHVYVMLCRREAILKGQGQEEKQKGQEGQGSR